MSGSKHVVRVGDTLDSPERRSKAGGASAQLFWRETKERAGVDHGRAKVAGRATSCQTSAFTVREP